MLFLSRGPSMFYRFVVRARTKQCRLSYIPGISGQIHLNSFLPEAAQSAELDPIRK